MRLNLQAIRGKRVRRQPQANSQNKASNRELELSRRDFLSAMASSPLLLESLSDPARPFELHGDERRLAFIVNGREAWVIDPGLFCGSPKLQMNKTGDGIRIRLSAATFPGTGVPADLICELRCQSAVWRMYMRMAAGLETETSFEKWLTGSEQAISSWRSELNLPDWRGDPWLKVSGPGKMQFRPDWSLEFKGEAVVRLGVSCRELASGSLIISLPDAGEPSFFDVPMLKRSLITMSDETGGWEIDTGAKSEDGWRIEADGNLFDKLVLEIGEAATGIKRAGMLLQESPQNAGSISLAPAEHLRDPDGALFRFPLTNPGYAFTIGESEEQSILTADFSDQPVWLHGAGFSLELGSAPEAEPVELIRINGQIKSLKVVPALLKVAPQLQDAAVTPITFDAPRQLPFTWGKFTDWIQHGVCALHLCPWEDALCIPLHGEKFAVNRTRDFLRLEFEIQNLTLKSRFFKLALEPAENLPPDKKPLIIVKFPPQHIAEEAFFEGHSKIPVDIPKDGDCQVKIKLEPDCGKTTDENLKSLPVQSRLSGPSRLSFSIPPEIKRIPFDLKSLLDWKAWNLEVNPRATRAGEFPDRKISPSLPEVGKPDDRETAIELPYRLLISPTKEAGWAHSLEPVDLKTPFTELWHTRLGIRGETGKPVNEEDSTHRTVRAIWSDDVKPLEKPPDHINSPFRMSLDARDRHELVRLTSDFKVPINRAADPEKYQIPAPVEVEQLMLSALGGWLKSRGAWNPPPPLTVEEWRQIATMGRDHYVRVVYKGFLFPFGHRASLIKVTERKFFDNPDGDQTAYLRQRMYIVVRQPCKDYPAPGQPLAGITFPFAYVKALTTVTPDLDDPATGGGNQEAFWPHVNGAPFHFQFQMHDVERGLSECSIPILFVDNRVAKDLNKIDPIIDLYNGNNGLRFPKFNGQKIAYAPSKKPGDTQFETDCVKLKAMRPAGASLDDLLKVDQPFFYPAIESAEIRISAVRLMTGKDTPIEVVYHDAYTNYGFSEKENRGEVFFALKNGALDLTLGGPGGAGADNAGGVVTPNMSIVGVSRRIGPVGGSGKPADNNMAIAGAKPSADSALEKIISGNFDPLEYFGGALRQAKFLGGINLWDIISTLAAGALDNLSRAPQMLNETFFEELGGKFLEIEQIIIRRLNNLPEIISNKLGPEIREVREAFAEVKKTPTDRKRQARLIGALIRLVDRAKTIIDSPNLLLEEAFRDLLPIVKRLEDELIAKALLKIEALKTLRDQILRGIKDRLSAINVNDQTRRSLKIYIDQITALINEISDAITQLEAITATPATFLERLNRIDAALQKLDRVLRTALILVELADQATPQNLADLRQKLEELRNRTVRDAEEAISDFQSRCLVWIQTLEHDVQMQAQALLREASDDLRAMQKAVNLWATREVQERLLPKLEKLVKMIVATGLTPENVALINRINEVAKNLTALEKALEKGTFEDIVAAVKPLLPPELKSELDELEGRIREVRDKANAAINDKVEEFLAYATRLHELWRKYQDPFELAEDVFGLNQNDINRLKQIREDCIQAFNEIKAYRDELLKLREAFLDLQKNLPEIAKRILQAEIDKVIRSLDELAGAVEERIISAQTKLIRDVLGIYEELLRRVTAPLEDIRKLIDAKDELARLILGLAIPESVTVNYDWEPDIKRFGNIFVPNEAPRGLTISVKVITYLRSGKPPEVNIQGTLNNFTINLIGEQQFISIRFNHLIFTSRSGAGANCEVNIDKVEFSEALSFVKKLQEILSPKDGPFVELKGLGILAGFRFGVPTIAVGAFSLQNLSLSVAVSLPFNGDPMRLEFAISRRFEPFLLSVGIFGGGGFFLMRLGPDGVEKLEGALEFGVVAEISIGIASGGGFIMAGIYFSIEANRSKLCGFVHAHGHLDIIGLISMEIDAFVQVCWIKRDGRNYVEGEARITVKIEMFFFSIEVTLEARYQFEGSPGGPALAASGRPELKAADRPARELELPKTSAEYCELIGIEDWDDYREAFAW